MHSDLRGVEVGFAFSGIADWIKQALTRVKRNFSKLNMTGIDFDLVFPPNEPMSGNTGFRKRKAQKESRAQVPLYQRLVASGRPTEGNRNYDSSAPLPRYPTKPRPWAPTNALRSFLLLVASK